MKISLIGAGNIGSEAYRQIAERGWSVPRVITRSGVYDSSNIGKFDEKLSDFLRRDPARRLGDTKDYINHLDDIDLVFLMIPTLDNGETAYIYIKELNERKIPVVTSEKGALSAYFEELEGSIDSGYLGFNASVGGGTHMLSYLEQRALCGDVREIHGVVNATLNFIFDKCSTRSLDNAVERAKNIGITEPGAYSPLEIVNTEATQDVPRKTAILFNTFMRALKELENYIRYDDLKPEPIDDRTLKKLIKEADNTRYIVSIERDKEESEPPTGGFQLAKGEWLIKGGFRKRDENVLFKKIWVPEEYNALVTYEGDYGSKGIYSINGEGAMPKPTVNTMIFDTLKMVNKGIIKGL